jgi:hypothetical protein
VIVGRCVYGFHGGFAGLSEFGTAEFDSGLRNSESRIGMQVTSFGWIRSLKWKTLAGATVQFV